MIGTMSRRMPLIGGVLVALPLLQALSFAAVQDPDVRKQLSDLVIACTAAVAAAVGVAVARHLRRTRSAAAPAWAAIAVAAVLYALGAVLNLSRGSGPGAPATSTLCDAYFMLCYPPMLLGLFWLPKEQADRRERVNQLLDIGALAFVAAMFVWEFSLKVLLGALRTNPNSGVYLSLGYAAMDSLLLLMLFYRVVNRLGSPRQYVPMLLLVAGCLLLIVSDTLQGYLGAQYVSGSFIDVGWSLFCALSGLAGLHVLRWAEGAEVAAECQPQRTGPLHSAWAMSITYLWLGMALSMLTWSAMHPERVDGLTLVVGVVGAVSLAVARQVRAVRESDRLYEQLRAAHAGLEDKVRERTDQVQAQAELLRQSEEKHRSIVEATRAWVWITDADGEFMYTNPAVEAHLGCTPDEFLRAGAGLLHPDDRLLREDKLAECRARGEGWSGLLTRWRRSDGTYRVFDGDAVPIIGPSGEVTGFQGADRDITDRLTAESALKETTVRYRELVENLNDAVYSLDCDGVITFASHAILNILGYEPEELVGRRLVDLACREDAAEVADCLERSLGGTCIPGLCRFVTKTGEERWCVVSDRPIIVDGATLGLTGLLNDVTAHMRAEEAIRESEEKFRQLFDQSADAQLLIDDGAIVDCNPAAETLSRAPREQIIGTRPETWAPERQSNGELSTDLSEHLVALAHQDGNARAQWVHRRVDGTTVDCELSLTVVTYEGRRILHAATRDVTDRTRAEKETQRQIRRLQGLRAIDVAITGSLDLELTLGVVLDEVIALTEAQGAAILVLNPHSLTLEYAARRSVPEEVQQLDGYPLGVGGPGRAALEQRIVTSLADPDDYSRVDEPIIQDGWARGAYHAVPLVAKGKVVGILEVFSGDRTPDDSEWLDFVEVLSRQAAIAVDNAQLFRDLQRSNTDLMLAYDATIEGWSRALDLRDKETEGHTQRVTALTVRLAKHLGVTDADIVHYRRGALLHDIGKMGVPDGILLKPGKLTDEEWVAMKRHTTYAYEMLSPIAFLRPALDIPYCHHERWDGKGYPRGLQGEQIPLAARMFAVIDVWDALTSDRVYRKALPEAEVRRMIEDGAGSQFDPDVVYAFLAMLDDLGASGLLRAA